MLDAQPTPVAHSVLVPGTGGGESLHLVTPPPISGEGVQVDLGVIPVLEGPEGECPSGPVEEDLEAVLRSRRHERWIVTEDASAARRRNSSRTTPVRSVPPDSEVSK